ncbi:hypothetical protein CCM_09296 [Cordyceps militaris CM01]|uniref:Uncharacterized protein n=1 Tax=Cordyceps militaris (strain CM01) TaxID=983644 RepID=G3JU06_CORMM|nr:uncharacterized protein CCM_09296 [Cordyceps militaris CM01]EGX88160.1 hypothetical protein CCM_09296 [Cordyceps militaris CM01]
MADERITSTVMFASLTGSLHVFWPTARCQENLADIYHECSSPCVLTALFAVSGGVSAAPVSSSTPVEVNTRGVFGDGSQRLGSDIQNLANNAGTMMEKGGAALSSAVVQAGQGADKAVSDTQAVVQQAGQDTQRVGQDVQKAGQQVAANVQGMAQQVGSEVQGMAQQVGNDVQGVATAAGHLAKGASNVMNGIGKGLASCASGENPACNK